MENIKTEYIPRKKEALKKVIAELKPSIAIIQVGHVAASDVYVRNKIKDCTEVNMPCRLVSLPETITEAELLAEIDKLNKDDSVNGFIVQLPLPKGISEEKVKVAVAKEKDIDGFNPLNNVVAAATPSGIITYLEDQGYDFVNKNAVVIGRSNIVGRPMAKLLLDRSCNVTVLHSKTSESAKRSYLRQADLVVVATGHRNTLTDEDLTWREYYGDDNEYYDEFENNDCFIVDVGMNHNEEGKLCGDCEAVTVCEKTPVPGGVGLLTRLQLIENTIKLCKIQKKYCLNYSEIKL